MKLSDIETGNRAIKRVKLPLVNARAPGLPDIPELAAQRAADRKDLEGNADESTSAAPLAPDDDRSIDVGVIVLTGTETALVLQRARDFAKAKGVEKWDDDDPLCTLGKMVHTLAIACVDPDSDPKDAVPFFDGGVDQILNSTHIGRDGIVYLFEVQESWQDQCSPQVLNLDPAEYLARIVALAEDRDSDPFDRLRPGTRWILARSMAIQLLASPPPRSSPISGTDPNLMTPAKSSTPRSNGAL